LLRFLPQTYEKIQSLAGTARPRLATNPVVEARADTPAIRTNALPITSYPALCRLVECNIGGFPEVEAAVEEVQVDIDARRCPEGVVAFGRDVDIRKAFDLYVIKAFKAHPLASARLARESGERAVVRDALFRALGKRPGLKLARGGRSCLLLPDPAAIAPAIFNTDRAKPVDRVAGFVPKTSINWTEACGLRLDYRLDTLWLLLEPRVVLDVLDGAPPDQLDVAREFVRERRARRHNRLANALLDGWIRLIVGDAASLRLRAFGIGDGIDAEFELMRVSGFSGAAQ
jgi:hypothetical protein